MDASLAFKWLVREKHTDEALAILHAWFSEEVTLTAPLRPHFEVSNALRRRVVRGEFSLDGQWDLMARGSSGPPRRTTGTYTG